MSLLRIEKEKQKQNKREEQRNEGKYLEGYISLEKMGEHIFLSGIINYSYLFLFNMKITWFCIERTQFNVKS